MLDYVVEAVVPDNRAGDYKLQQLEDFHPITPALARRPVDRSIAGNIVPGKYVIGKLPWAINILMLTFLQRL